jgi:hypothetical protein
MSEGDRQGPEDQQPADADQPQSPEPSRLELPKATLSPDELRVDTVEPHVALAEHEAAARVEPPPERLSYFDRRMGASDVLAAFVVAIVAFAAVTISYEGIGMSWDEAMYRKPARAAGQWLTGVAGGNSRLMRTEEIDAAWSLNPEIAPVPKLAVGLGEVLLAPRGVDPLIAMRLPIALAFALTVAMIFALGTRCYGRTGGFAAAVMYVLMPRVFGHAHIAASETLLALMTVLVAWAFLWGVTAWQAAYVAAIMFALAINTKVTALILPVPLFIWGQVYRRREYGPNMFAMLFLTPLVVALTWPWLWQSGVSRFLDYLKFYVDHQSTAVFYNGRIWGYLYGSPAPWTYPWVITGVSLPEFVLVFAAIGIARALFQVRNRPVQVLFVTLALFPLLVSSLPNAPKYDGERLFFAAFAFIALLAGGGYAGLVSVLSWGWRAGGFYNAYRAWLAGFVLMLIALWGIIDLARTHPNELNYFNRLVGGADGAYDQGFETSYWGEAMNDEVVDWLNNNTRPGQKVLPMAMNGGVLEHLQEWRKLRRDVDFTPQEPPFDYYLLQVRQGFLARRERTLRSMHDPVKAFVAQGVPRIEVYPGSALPEFASAPETTATASATTETVAAAPLPPGDTAATTVPASAVTTAPAGRVSISDSERPARRR